MKNILASIAIFLALVAIGISVTPKAASHAVGGVTTVLEQFGAGIQVGDQARALTFDTSGTCNPSFSGTSLAATSTGQFVCTVTGARSGDMVTVVLPSGARTSANSWFSVVDGYATTSDRIGFDMANWTGTATSSFAQATTSVSYRVTRSTANP